MRTITELPLRRSIIEGPLFTVVLIFAIELLDRTAFRIPNPAPVYLAAVVYAAFSGGLAPGLISGAITMMYACYFFSIPGQVFHYTPDNASRVIILFVATPAITLMAGVLKRRSEQAVSERDIIIAELKTALAEIKTLRGFLPICYACKKVRDDQGYWKQVEIYIEERSSVEFTHGLCPECAIKNLAEIEDYKNKRASEQPGRVE
jgi:K+-sensing histidine kinase KdpD